MQTQLVQPNDPFIRRLRELNILQNLDRKRIKRANGIILVGCSDKNRFFDLFLHLWFLCMQWKIHTFAWHGGALRLPSGSAANTGNSPGFALDLLKELLDAVMTVAKTPTIVLSVHMPCGKARLSGMNKYAVLQTHSEAKDCIKQVIGAENVNVHPVVHIHYAERWRLGFLHGWRRKRSYFFDTDLWLAANRQEGPELRRLAA